MLFPYTPFFLLFPPLFPSNFQHKLGQIRRIHYHCPFFLGVHGLLVLLSLLFVMCVFGLGMANPFHVLRLSLRASPPFLSPPLRERGIPPLPGSLLSHFRSLFVQGISHPPLPEVALPTVVPLFVPPSPRLPYEVDRAFILLLWEFDSPFPPFFFSLFSWDWVYPLLKAEPCLVAPPFFCAFYFLHVSFSTLGT